jgi:hypothetical protein
MGIVVIVSTHGFSNNPKTLAALVLSSFYIEGQR